MKMNSFYATLYLDIQERIQNRVPEIKDFELDFGQEKYKTWRETKDFPMMLLRFSETTYEAAGSEGQVALIEVNLKLLFTPYNQFQDTDPIEVCDDVLNVFEIEQKVVEALHDWNPGDYCQNLVRSKIASVNCEEMNLHVRELTFTTLYEEYR